jgi:hypothetical protein
MKAARITKEQTEQVINLLEKHNAKEIAEIVGVTYYQVHEVKKRFGLTLKQHPIFNLTDLQEQIILGGKLGDGNFKQNGKNGFYYRESHAEDELEYLTWKMNSLGEDIIAKGGLYKIKKQGFNVQQPYGFSTKTSETFATYANMSIEETIEKLNYQGLIMFMLDDGWFSDHSKTGNFLISGGVISRENLELICSKFDEYGIKNVHITGKKRLDISIPSENNFKLFEMATSFIPEDTDIIKKKFNKVKQTI